MCAHAYVHTLGRYEASPAIQQASAVLRPGEMLERAWRLSIATSLLHKNRVRAHQGTCYMHTYTHSQGQFCTYQNNQTFDYQIPPGGPLKGTNAENIYACIQHHFLQPASYQQASVTKRLILLVRYNKMFVQIVRVKCWSHKFVLHKVFIAPYATMYETLERVNKTCTNLSRSPF